MRSCINHLFKSGIRDIMTGCRAFSFYFVKTFPVLSRGFEIETEMSIHAVEKNMAMKNIILDYRDRPEGSRSKLNTFSDGFRVLKTIFRLYRDYKPMHFFGLLGLVLLILSAVFFIPVFREYLETGLVPDFPTLIVCGFCAIAAFLSLFSGLILQSQIQKDRQAFEFRLQLADWEYKRQTKKEDADENGL